MELITATNFKPVGLDSQLLNYIESKLDELKLSDSTIYRGLVLPSYTDDGSHSLELALLSEHHGLVLIHVSGSLFVADDDRALASMKHCAESMFKEQGIAIPVMSHLFIFDADSTMDLGLSSPVLSRVVDISDKLALQSVPLNKAHVMRANELLKPCLGRL